MTRSGVRSPSAPPVLQNPPDLRNIPEIRAFLNALATHRCYTSGMSDMGKPTDLARRKGSASWQFRKRWPKHLWRPGDPTEIWISLETTSYKEALEKLPEVRARAERRFNHEVKLPDGGGIYTRSAPPQWPSDEDFPLLSSEQAAPLARSLFVEAVRDLDCQPPIPADTDQQSIHGWRAELETMIARLTGPEPADGIDDVAGARFAVLRKAKLRAEQGSEALDLLNNYLRRAIAQAHKIELARLGGDFSDKITDRLFANCLTSASAGQPASMSSGFRSTIPAGVMEQAIGKAADRYLEDLLADKTTDKTKDRYRAELKHIVAFFGSETPVWRLHADECDRFRDVFAKLPPNFEDKIRGGSDIATIVATRGDDDRVLAYATLEKYLSQLSRFLQWAHSRDYIAKNYADGLKPRAIKPDGSMAKLPFEDEELRRIFQRPIYTGCRDDGRNFAKVGPNIMRRARYWAPLIGLFSGLRCGEILQLTTDHIRISPEGNDFIVLTQDMRLKSDNAVREIPVHPVLKAIGFIEWVQRRRDRCELALFPEVPAHSNYDDQSSRFSKWYESALRYFELGDRRKKLTFHSFRHTFVDCH